MSSGSLSFRASAETEEQLEALLESERIDIIYIDAGWFDPGDLVRLSDRVHEAGKGIGLRLPAIFRSRDERYMDEHLSEIRDAGFDLMLHRSLESLGYMRDRGLEIPFMLDHQVYDMNGYTEQVLAELCGTEDFDICLPLELSFAELRELCRAGRKQERQGHERLRELVVYGYAPMMVSAQCIRATEQGCDGASGTRFITDRTGRRLPVRNCCRSCCNTIYNSVPTKLYDMEKELASIDHGSRRYEFTLESGDEVRAILSDRKRFEANGFTRGWSRKGVM